MNKTITLCATRRNWIQPISFFLFSLVGGTSLLTSHAAQAQCQAGTGVMVVTTANANQYFSIGGGQTLCISSGVSFTGGVTLTSAGATINNYGMWSGGYNIGGGYAATINNFGTWSGDISVSNATINNNGTWSASQIGYTNGLTLTIGTNGSFTSNLYAGNPGGNLTVTNAGTFNQTLGIPNSGTHRFTNTGTATFANLYTNGGAVTIDNSGSFTVANTFNTNNVTLNNAAAGTLTTTAGGAAISTNSTFSNAGTWNAGALSVNGALVNSGTVQAASFTNNGGAVTNQRSFTTSGNFTINSGSFANLYLLNVRGNLSNGGTISGPTNGSRSAVRVAGTSTNNGAFGATGLLDFCDESSTNATQPGGFDTQNTAPGTNTTYCTRTAAAPLPVTLKSFSAAREGAVVKLRWATATETNNLGFGLERSPDGKQWQQLAFVPGQGQGAAYQWQHEAPARAAYYRLAQQDLDGTRTYSPVAFVAGAEAVSFTLYPNPAHDQVQLAGLSAAEAPVLLLDGRGQLVRKATSTTIDLKGLPAGLYLVRCGSATARLVVE